MNNCYKVKVFVQSIQYLGDECHYIFSVFRSVPRFSNTLNFPDKITIIFSGVKFTILIFKQKHILCCDFHDKIDDLINLIFIE